MTQFYRFLTKLTWPDQIIPPHVSGLPMGAFRIKINRDLKKVSLASYGPKSTIYWNQDYMQDSSIWVTGVWNEKKKQFDFRVHRCKKKEHELIMLAVYWLIPCWCLIPLSAFFITNYHNNQFIFSHVSGGSLILQIRSESNAPVKSI